MKENFDADICRSKDLLRVFFICISEEYI